MCKCGDDFSSSANTRIVVQSAATTDDGYGGRSQTWSDAFTLWAVVEPVHGREIYVNSQLQSRVDARILIRFQSALSDTTTAAQYRVKVGSRFFNIRAVKNLAPDLKIEGRDFQQMLCVEGEPS